MSHNWSTMSISVLQTLDGVEGTQEIELYLWVVAAWAAGMACSGGSTASRGWWRGRYGGGGVPAGLQWVGRGSGRRRRRWRRCSAHAVGGAGRRRHQAQMRNQVLGEGRRRKEIYGGGLLSRVNPRPGTKGPFVPGRGFTRDKRGFWAGWENSQPAAHL